MNNGNESTLEQYKFTKVEREWLSSIKNHHSYFMMELSIENNIKRVYLMDASNAPELTEEDKKNYNFERRVDDEGVKQVKLNRKAFLKFWDKHLTLSLNGKYAVEYVTHRRYQKLFRCRPFGWVLSEFQD